MIDREKGLISRKGLIMDPSCTAVEVWQLKIIVFSVISLFIHIIIHLMSALKKSGTTTIEDIVNSNSVDKLQVFIMSWNMGNAAPGGLEYVFREKNATNDYDILVLGLQEATWAQSDCIKDLGEKVQEIVGDKFFLVNLNCSQYIFFRSTNLFYCLISVGQACVSRSNAAVRFCEEVDPVPHYQH